MKLATYKDGSRDGQLVVVSRDLATAHYATGMAGTMRQLLDDWNFIAPQLQDLYVTLNQGRARHAFPFEPRMCMAPLPRASQWVEARDPVAWSEAREAGRQAAGPALMQSAGDDLLGPCDDAVVVDESLEADLGPGIAVLTGDLPLGSTPGAALDGVRLLLLYNAVWLRRVEAQELQQGLGLLQARVATAFGPVAVTPDEVGDAWQQGRLALSLTTSRNGQRQGRCDAGAGDWHFGQLLAHLCRTRRLRGGTLLGAEMFPRPQDGASGHGGLSYGDVLGVEVQGRDGQSLFGAIDQVISPVD